MLSLEENFIISREGNFPPKASEKDIAVVSLNVCGAAEAPEEQTGK